MCCSILTNHRVQLNYFRQSYEKPLLFGRWEATGIDFLNIRRRKHWTVLKDSLQNNRWNSELWKRSSAQRCKMAESCASRTELKSKREKYTVGIAIFSFFVCQNVAIQKMSEVLIPIHVEYSSFTITCENNQRSKNLAWLVTCVKNNATQTSAEGDVRVVRENLILWATEQVSVLVELVLFVRCD